MLWVIKSKRVLHVPKYYFLIFGFVNETAVTLLTAICCLNFLFLCCFVLFNSKNIVIPDMYSLLQLYTTYELVEEISLPEATFEGDVTFNKLEVNNNLLPFRATVNG